MELNVSRTGESEGGSARRLERDGARSLAIAPVAMMLPTFLGPLMMVIGESNGDPAKTR